MFYVRREPLIWRGTFADLRLYSSGFLEIEFGGVQEEVTEIPCKLFHRSHLLAYTDKSLIGTGLKMRITF
jgi:hypothetical protein